MSNVDGISTKYCDLASLPEAEERREKANVRTEVPIRSLSGLSSLSSAVTAQPHSSYSGHNLSSNLRCVILYSSFRQPFNSDSKSHVIIKTTKMRRRRRTMGMRIRMMTVIKKKSVMAAGGLRLKELALTGDKSRSLVRGREA